MGESPASYARKVVAAIVTLILGIAFGPVVVDLIQGVNTTAWVFTGHEAAEQVIEIIPLLYYAGVLLGSGMAFLKA